VTTCRGIDGSFRERHWQNGKLAITPDVITAWATVDLELRNINLRDYVLKAAH
jgi:hypothetical protein